jgi:para-aminobenzoate synthetase component 1
MAIRTMLTIGDRLYFSVGAGIVADSDPALEYEETMIKAKAMFDTLPKS